MPLCYPRNNLDLSKVRVKLTPLAPEQQHDFYKLPYKIKVAEIEDTRPELHQWYEVFTPKEIQEIIDLGKQGLQDGEIAEVYYCSLTTVGMIWMKDSPAYKELFNPKPKKTPMKRKTKAFTLIEVMIVVAVLGLLAAIMIPAITKSKKAQAAHPRIQLTSEWVKIDQRSECAMVRDSISMRDYCVIRDIQKPQAEISH